MITPGPPALPAPRSRSRLSGKGGVTLVEVVCAMAVLIILTTLAMPLARNAMQRRKEAELHRALNVMCAAIDRYHRYALNGAIKPWDPEWEGYPPDLETLVEGVEVAGQTGKQRTEKLLREVPEDPLTGERTWGLRSYQNEPDEGWDGKNVYDVYSLSQGTALDGTNYNEWGCEDVSHNEPGFSLR
jgi:general secretion pathway protein G